MSARDKIIKAAMDLFWAKGFNSTSIADILARTQLNSGSLYHVFPSKQDVLVGVLEAYRDGIEQMLLEPAWSGIDDPIEKIFALLQFYRVGIVETDCAYGCPIGSLALELHEPDPIVRELMAQNFAKWTGAVEALLKQAGARLPRDIDRAALAQFVLTTMEGGVMQARTHRDVAYFDAGVAQLRTYLDFLEARASAKEGTR